MSEELTPAITLPMTPSANSLPGNSDISVSNPDTSPQLNNLSESEKYYSNRNLYVIAIMLLIVLIVIIIGCAYYWLNTQITESASQGEFISELLI